MEENVPSGVESQGLAPLALGTMAMGDQTDALAARRIVDAAIDAGVNHIDTANVYVGGRSEQLLGNILEGRRQHVFLASKVGIPKEGPGTQLDPATIRKELEGSLQRLRTDYLDLYYLHRPDRAVHLEDSLGALAELIDEGLIRHIGTSNYPAWQLVQAHEIARRQGWLPARIAQPMYNLLARRVEDEYAEATMTLGIANVVYNPLAGGLLSGKYRRTEPAPPGTRFAHDQFRDRYRHRYWHEANFAAIGLLQVIADDAHMPLAELALRWLVSREHVHSIILGVSRVDQLLENIEACRKGPLPPDLLAACDEVKPLVHGPAPLHVM